MKTFVDERTAIIVRIGPTATVAFAATLLAVLQHQARRHGLSLFRNLGTLSWSLAVLVIFAASMFSGALMGGLVTPYNVPLDWTPFLVWAPVQIALGLLSFSFARRKLVRETSRRHLPPA